MSAVRGEPPAPPPRAPGDGERARSVTLALLGFGALAAFAATHWAHLLLAAPPAGRVALALLAVLAGGTALALLSAARPRLAPALAALAALASLVLALAAVGIPPRLLYPSGWGELASEIDRGFAGLADEVDYPYGGANEWSRLAILAGLALGLALAAALAFWPARARRAARLRLLALVALVALYVTAAGANPPGGEIGRGLVLFLLVAGWLWLPGLRRREGPAAMLALALAAALAVPVAAALDGDEPWLEYEDWRLSAAPTTTYNWDHSYGVLGWPRDGRTMLEARSDEPHYWRASALDRFDGTRWVRSDSNLSATPAPERLESTTGLARANAQWVERVGFTIGSLESELVLSPGTPLEVSGLDDVDVADDGIAARGREPLSEGDGYAVRAYVPEPAPARMRSAPARYPAALARYTEIGVPGTPPIASAGPSVLRPADVVQVPLRGGGGEVAQRARVAARLAESPYGGLQRLATRLTAGAPTAYDAARAIQRHLEAGYAYDEDPPYARYPLAAFVGEDRVGYCQQFSGAMALMLRMVGIPARVAAGFAPGTPDLEREAVFTVDDFDAHSWVEIYFSGIGWVAFDPTPAAAPASAGGGFTSATVVERGRLGVAPISRGRADPLPRAGGDGTGDGGLPLWVPGAAFGALAAALCAALVVRSLHHRRLGAAAAREAQVREIDAALTRLGYVGSPGRTLVALEQRLEAAGHGRAAGYLARLRAGRYAPDRPPPPSLAERTAVRRELSAGQGLGRRLRALRALPPGGPAPRPAPSSIPDHP